MKFTFDKDVFLKELAIAQEIISNKTAISILSNVLLTAKEGSLILKATDIKVNFETKIPVDIQEEGSTTVFCDKFVSVISSLPQGEIEITEKDQKLIITSVAKKAKFQLRTISDNDFPVFSEPDNIQFFEINTKDFKEMIEQTVFSVSDDETRYFMNGVYMEKKNENLIFVATDGRRLAYIEKNFGITIPDFKGIIIPPKILSIINRRTQNEGSIAIGVGEKNIFFNFGSYKFSSVLIDGQFPNYDKVIPENQDKSFEIEKSELTDALKRVALLVEQKTRRIFFNLNSGSLIISSEENELGQAKEEIPCQYEGDEIVMALNYLYVEEPLKVINSDRIKIEFTDPMRAITLRAEPNKDFFHIIMPMQIE
ncbi:DNA polymerase III subunit beta [Treponema phagedenis]|uniref:Beta sliding clamp n=1 Tax=Treponema phagedenis TaxID=162 RepID=A0A0B7GV75_TREPH|nr:DNA polymerase III subunit beta [Treponema phagedenis]EFW39074.1 DNA polymerase III, beta subunit [Treponema phagedenis F0421]NVP23878.1 DNA polymerase III subunit beta [Treponema phagedenis]QEJ93755.1 DNA polymerase III subunit beta [Treponema phagedenis]QEJ96546.1 DNA polymerase III subunit beta [Treponema phagedenis]QEJ99715.1 DNA polymerase III subunit beta [Treponema phagedenis]